MKSWCIEGLLLKYWYITRHTLDRIADMFYWPFFALLMWGFITLFVKGAAMGLNVIAIFLGGLMLWTFLQRAQQDINVYILQDFWDRNIFNMFATPMTVGELLTSTVLLGLVRSCIVFVFLAAVAWLLYAFNIFSGGIIVIAGLAAALMLFGWALGIFVSGMIFRFGTRIQFFTWSIAFLLQPFVAVFYPLEILPAWLQQVSLLFPPTYVFEGMRAFFDTGLAPWSYLGWALAIDMVYLALATIIFKMWLNTARRKGLLMRY